MLNWNVEVVEQIKKEQSLFGRMASAIAGMEEYLNRFQIPGAPRMEADLKRLTGAGGKRIRPSLAWICWDMGQGDRLPVIPLMCMLELMHTASLIHDDIVDQAPIRRGVETLHTTGGNRYAAMAGDYLLGMAMEHLSVYRGTGINEMLAEVSTQMCLGEMQEMRLLYDVSGQSKKNYYVQISRKTASLLAASCYAGAAAGGLTGKSRLALRTYGEQIGMAFQLKDDILDFTAEEAFGKQPCQDLRSGIFTLPLLHAFEAEPDPEMIALAAKRQKTQEDVSRIRDYVMSTNGLAYSEDCVSDCSSRAIDALEAVPEGEHREALALLAEELGKRMI